MHPALRQTAAGLAALTPQSIQSQAAAAAAALCGIKIQLPYKKNRLERKPWKTVEKRRKSFVFEGVFIASHCRDKF